MLRFTFTALALLSTGLLFTAEAKDKPPQISVCAADICLTELRWTQPSSFLRTTEPAVDGVLVNTSGSAVSLSSLNFALEAGPALLGTAADYYSGVIPPAGGWHFHASFSDMIGGRFVMKIHAVQLAYTEDGVRHAGTLEFDPLFAPVADWQRKAWEKIHGKRQR